MRIKDNHDLVVGLERWYVDLPAPPNMWEDDLWEDDITFTIDLIDDALVDASLWESRMLYAE